MNYKQSIKSPAFVLVCLCVLACSNNKKAAHMDSYEKGTFGHDLDFLNKNDSVIVLTNQQGTAQIIVSPKYQGKVFTSTADGLKGKSFGWINYKAFKPELDPHMNGYGGEDRLWLGPEGGKFSLYFKPGTKMEFANWHTPAAIDSEPWLLKASDKTSVSMSKDMTLQNYAGTTLKINLKREIQIMENADIASTLGISLDSIKAVGFKTSNTLMNTGAESWTEQTGAPCMWNLDMFAPSPKTVIVVPYVEAASGKVATTDYFGEIDKDRIVYQNGVLLFKADGKSRGKLGIPPNRAKKTIGSYDLSNNVLTIASFDLDKKGRYLNQEWTPDKDPFTGDAVNAYNDGPLADGTQMGPFYEIESVSPAAFLNKGQTLTHQHSVYHFTGDKARLDVICQKLLGISLNQIEAAFK
jgi:hypothetical protein